MKKKYKIRYTWHSGECFDARLDKEIIIEINERDLDSWRYYFEHECMDGSYCSINSIEEIEDN